MRKIMDHLLALQKLQFDLLGQTVTSKAEAEQLRGEVPSPILAHYERLVARGKKGLALVRTGVCSECHLRLTAGKLVNLSATPNEIHLCDNLAKTIPFYDWQKSRNVSIAQSFHYQEKQHRSKEQSRR